MVSVNETRSAVEQILSALDLLRREQADLDCSLRSLLEAYEYCMDALCPHKVGHRVMLVRAPVITETVNHGWLGSKHFLVVGARGTIVKAACDGSGFCFYVTFDDDSFIHPVTGETIARVAGERGRYFFRQEYLIRAYEEDDNR